MTIRGREGRVRLGMFGAQQRRTSGAVAGAADGTIVWDDGVLTATVDSFSGAASSVVLRVSVRDRWRGPFILPTTTGVPIVLDTPIVPQGDLPVIYAFGPTGGKMSKQKRITLADITPPEFEVTQAPDINLGAVPIVGGGGTVTPPEFTDGGVVTAVDFFVRVGTEEPQPAGDYLSWGFTSLPDISTPQNVVIPASAANTTVSVRFSITYAGEVYTTTSGYSNLVTSSTAAPAQIQTGNATFGDSGWVTSAETDFKPTWEMSGLGTIGELEWTVSEDPSIDGLWHPTSVASGVYTTEKRADWNGSPENPHWFQLGSPRLGRFRLRWRPVAGTGLWSPYSQQFTVPDATLSDPEQPTNAEAYRPSRAAMDKIGGRAPLFYRVPFAVGPNSTENNGVNQLGGMVIPVAYALSAYSGDPRVFTSASSSSSWSGTTYSFPASTTAADRLLYQLRSWGNTSQTMPRAQAGYPAQFEMGFMSTVLIARMIPAIWNALTSAERNRLSLVMEACGYASCFTHSATHPYPDGFGQAGNGRNRTIRGYTSGLPPNGWNISGPPNLQPVIAGMFFSVGLDEPVGATFQRMLGDFDRDAFAARLNAAGGCQDAYETFRRQWTSAVQLEMHGSDRGGPVGDGPTAAQIYASLNNGYTRSQVVAKRADGTVSQTYWRNRAGSGIDQGIRVTEPRRMFKSQVDYFFRHTIRPGYPNPPAFGGTSQSGVSGTWGLNSPLTGGVRACFTPGTWDEIRNIGQTGMGDEMLQTDGGNPNLSQSQRESSPNLRSSVSYTQQSFVAMVSSLAAIAVYNPPQEAGIDFTAARARVGRAIQFFEDCDRLGYRSWAKDGWTNSENWSSSNANSVDAITRYEVARIFTAAMT